MTNPHKKHGGKRPGSGRKRGTPNKATVELKQLAGEYTEEAIQVFVDVMRDPEAPVAVRVAAADKLLDRGHGRPAQSVELANTKVDKELLQQLEQDLMARLERARERQRLVLIERGIIQPDEDI